MRSPRWTEWLRKLRGDEKQRRTGTRKAVSNLACHLTGCVTLSKSCLRSNTSTVLSFFCYDDGQPVISLLHMKHES